ncbi:hypothetical protein KKH05_02700 [Patescibacteria group bacterium]|nr:hypothetical protein [Patescibacteria group bacterium]
MNSKNGGQSLFEIIIAVGVAAIIIGSATMAMTVSLKSSKNSAESQKAYAITQSILENIRSYAEANWATLYATSTPGQTYYLAEDVITATSTTLSLNTGTTTILLFENSATTTYTAWFVIENVYRDSNNNLSTSTSEQKDPITLKATIHVSWPIGGSTREIELPQYISRIKSDTYLFTDWGGSALGTITSITNPLGDDYYYASSVMATGASGGSITLTDTESEGYLESLTFDTGKTDGFAINSIMWNGTQNSGAVSFQIAVFNALDADITFRGLGGSTILNYQASEGIPITIDSGITADDSSKSHNFFRQYYRYFRYRVYISRATPDADTAPVLDSVVINWSY